MANYLVRADGAVLRVVTSGFSKDTIMPAPEGAKYIASCAMQSASYLLRDDGAVDRTTGYAKVNQTMLPPIGLRYLQVSAGRSATYLVRSDGRVDRTTGYGKVNSTLEVPSQTTIVRHSDGCTIC